MEDRDRQAIRKCYTTLIDGLDQDIQLVTNDLFGKGILSKHDTQKVRAGHTAYDQAQALLDMLPRRGPDAYKEFRATLRNHGADDLVAALDYVNPPSSADLDELTEDAKKLSVQERKPPKGTVRVAK